jgi:AraC-binding-like domain
MARSANGAYPHPDDAGPVAMIAQPTRVAEPLREFRVLRTRDPDEMCREVAGQLSAHRLELASRREFCATVNRVQLGATTLMHLAYGTPVRVTTDPLEDHVVLMLPIARPMRVEMKDRVTQVPKRPWLFRAAVPRVPPAGPSSAAWWCGSAPTTSRATFAGLPRTPAIGPRTSSRVGR